MSVPGKRVLTLGCAGFGLVLVVLAGVVGYFALLAKRSESIDHPVTAYPVTAPRNDDIAEAAERPDDATTATNAGAAGRIEILLMTGQLFVEPALPGEGLSLEAHYDPNYYALEESMQPGSPWTYRVEFRATSTILAVALREALEGNPSLRLRLPPDVLIDLDSDVRKGVADVDLGGLRLRDVDLRLDKGALDLHVGDEPRLPMRHLVVEGSQGSAQLRGLNRLSPESIDVEFEIGSVRMDLRGEWARDARIRASTSIAETILRLPREASIQGLDGVEGLEGWRPLPTPATEIPPATLRFQVEHRTRAHTRVLR